VCTKERCAAGRLILRQAEMLGLIRQTLVEGVGNIRRNTILAMGSDLGPKLHAAGPGSVRDRCGFSQLVSLSVFLINSEFGLVQPISFSGHSRNRFRSLAMICYTLFLVKEKFKVDVWPMI
jgi:hypothetical protein